MVASVPVLTKRTVSPQGTASQMRLARRTVGSLMQWKVDPFPIWACTAWTIAGCACPRRSGPEPIT